MKIHSFPQFLGLLLIGCWPWIAQAQTTYLPLGEGLAHLDLPDGPVVYHKCYNDQVMRRQVDIILRSSDSRYRYQDFQAGLISLRDLAAEAPHIWLFQDEAGVWHDTTREAWNHIAAYQPFDWDLVVDLASIPFDAVGDAAAGAYYLYQGDYENATYCVIAIVVPFANGQMLKAGKYLVKKGLKGSLKAAEMTPKEIWKMSPGLRGEVIEDIMAKTRYKKAGFIHMREVSWYWPIFDFVKGNTVISVKTTTATKGFGSLFENVRELKWLLDTKRAKNGQTIISQARLDVYLPEGYDVSLLNDLKNFGRSLGISVNMFIF